MNEDTVFSSLEDFAEMQTKEPTKGRDALYKPVVEYSMEGVCINSFESAAEASRFHNLKGNLSNVCRGRSLYCKKTGTVFLYRGDDINERLKLINPVSLDLPARATKAVEVWEYSLGGKLLYKWPSYKTAAIAAKTTPHAIAFCCKGKSLFIGKKTYLYPNGDIKQRVIDIKRELYRLSKKRPKYREVDEYSIDGKFIKAYLSASAASKECGIHVSNITRCCKGMDGNGKVRLTAGGKIFLWVGGSISERIDLINSLKNSNYDKE